MSGRDLDALIGAMPTHELEEFLMNQDPFLEADPLYRRAREKGANSGQGHNLDGFHTERSSWWLVAVATVLVVVAIKVVL